jgi:peptidoglycan/xylan/chitin deacetylase (PgdA/CDA1 family)
MRPSHRHVSLFLTLVVVATVVVVPGTTPSFAATPDVPVILRDRSWYIRGGASFAYGRARDVHLMGDWNGDGVSTPGVFRSGRWLLRNSRSAGTPDLDFWFGTTGDLPVIGDWDGNGTTTVGVVRDNTWYLRNRNSSSTPDITFRYGRSSDIKVTGDWNGNGRTGIGIVRGAEWRLRDAASAGTATYIFTYGALGDRPVVGDWNGNGRDAIGMVRGTTWRLRNSLSAGDPHLTYTYGQCGDGAMSTSGVQTVPSVPTSMRGTEWNRLPTTDKVVALTFDAGANADGLASILSTLNATSTPATFFLTGAFVAAYPTQSATVAARYPVGNHTMTHPDLTTLSDAGVRKQIIDAEVAIRKATDAEVRPWFRFPFGARDSRTIGLANCLNYGSVRWTVDTLGWKGTSGGQSATTVHDRVVNTLVPGQIVLMHVGSNPTDHSTLDADALPRIISSLKARGYRFVTLVPYRL